MKSRLPGTALALLLSACGAPEPAAPPPPSPAPAPIVATIDPRSAPGAPAKRKANQVQFTVKNADLATEVLPLFQQQVGVSISWHGDPRPVSLRLSQPMDWEEALSLVCQWTKTHPARDWQGKFILKDGWGGDLGDGDLRSLEEGGKATPGRTRGG